VSTKFIEKQLADLQKRLAHVESEISSKSRDRWKQIVGSSKGQSLDHEAARLGAQWRAKENKRK
jgi:hypothetical protein